MNKNEIEICNSKCVRLPSKRFRLVSEQRTRDESQRPRKKMAQVKERGGGGEERKETVSFLRLLFPSLIFFGSRFISCAVQTENLLPWCFFASKPNGNDWYAG